VSAPDLLAARDGALAEHDLVDPTRVYTNIQGNSVLA